tara:strand:- start:636 stop:1124 length:489 start_codon:yes stop_codon:yes gene_type:complete
MVLKTMNRITQFFKDTLATLFGEHAGVDAEVNDQDKVYNQTQVKAGIIDLRNHLVRSDRSKTVDDYNEAFWLVRLKPQMSGDDLYDQMDSLLDQLTERGLITEEESSRVNRDLLVASMTQTVTKAIEENDMNQNLLNAVRFDQELRNPHLKIVHSSTSMDNE